MVGFLARIFIKNNDYEDENVRMRYGVLCGSVGIFLNVLLFIGKLVAGMVSGSIAIMADAFNNLSDAGSSIITLVGFRMASQKPDTDHPYGHGRAEYISGLLVAVVIILMAYELLKESVGKIIHPKSIEVSALVIGILIVSILVKIYMAYYNKSIGKKINSAAMGATATDSLSDTVATSVVLVATILGWTYGIKLDGYLGVVVSIFVFLAGYNAAKDTINPLLGQPPSREFVDKIEKIVMSYADKDVIGLHDLMVHDYGPGRKFISVHVEVPSDNDILAMHDLIDIIEQDLSRQLNCIAVIHMDPVCVNDPETNELKKYVKEAIDSLNKKYPESKVTFHDFRLVKGPTHTNLIFDIVLPYDFELEESEVVRYIQTHVYENNNKYFCAINVDREYV